MIKYFLLILSSLLISCVQDTPFDEVVWKSSYHCKPIELARKRYAMVHVIPMQLIGKNKVQIIDVLGESLPDNVLASKKRDLLYCLGNSMKSLYQMRWMAIHLDSSGR